MAQAFLGTTGKKPKAPTIPKLKPVVKKKVVKKKLIDPVATSDVGITQPWDVGVQPTATSDAGIIEPWKANGPGNLPFLRAEQPNYADLISKQYEQERQAKLLSLRGKLQGSEAALGEQQALIAPAYQQARTDVDVQSQQKARRLKELLGGMGLAEGTQAMQQTQLGAASQQAITGLGQQEQAAQDQIARERSQLQQAYSGGVSEMEAALAAQKTGSYIEQSRLDQASALAQTQQEFANDLANRTYELQAKGFTADEAYRKAQLEMQQAGLTGQYQGQATLPYLEATRPKPTAPKETDYSSIYNRVSGLSKQSPELARSYVQTLNIPDAQKQQILQSIQDQPQDQVDTGPYTDYIESSFMYENLAGEPQFDKQGTSQYINRLLQQGAIERDQADQMRLTYNLPDMQSVIDDVQRRNENNEISDEEAMQELTAYGIQF